MAKPVLTMALPRAGTITSYALAKSNPNTQQFEEGFYRTAASFIIDFAKHQFNKETFGKPFKKELQPYEIRNLKKGAVDLAMTLGLMSLYLLVNAAEKDDKDEI